MNIGDKVSIKAPFKEAYPDVYSVKEIDTDNNYIIVEEFESAIDFRFIDIA